MNFRPGWPGKTEPADAEPTDAELADAEPAADTKPDVAAPTTTEVPAPRDEDVTPREDAADTADAKAGTPAADTVPAQPSFQPKNAAQPLGTPAFFSGPPDDDSLEGPLLPDATQLRGNWQRILASFIDDPHGSVAEAAALVDHAAQALAGALQQRQRRLRESWDTADGATGGASPDTEQLRVAMQRYRTLFNHICQP